MQLSLKLELKLSLVLKLFSLPSVLFGLEQWQITKKIKTVHEAAWNTLLWSALFLYVWTF